MTDDVYLSAGKGRRRAFLRCNRFAENLVHSPVSIPELCRTRDGPHVSLNFVI